MSELTSPPSNRERSGKSMGTVRSVLGSDPIADPHERNSLEERIERVARAQLAERQRSTPHAMPPSNRGVGSSRFLQRWVDLLQRRPRRRSGGAIGRSIAVIVWATLAGGSVGSTPRSP